MADQDDPVSAARNAIWQLYQAGLIDDDAATVALLAISIGLRRAQSNVGRDGTST
jgi:hypothetical protein